MCMFVLVADSWLRTGKMLLWNILCKRGGHWFKQSKYILCYTGCLLLRLKFCYGGFIIKESPFFYYTGFNSCSEKNTLHSTVILNLLSNHTTCWINCCITWISFPTTHNFTEVHYIWCTSQSLSSRIHLRISFPFPHSLQVSGPQSCFKWTECPLKAWMGRQKPTCFLKSTATIIILEGLLHFFPCP